MSEAYLSAIRESIDVCDHDSIRDAIVDVVDIFHKAGLLIYAVRCGARCCVRLLLDAGCDPCLRYEGRTALYWAVVADDTDILDLLLSDIVWILQATKPAFRHRGTATDNPITDTRIPPSPIPTSPQSHQNGCFSFCRVGQKRTEIQKQLAKVERALNTALFDSASHAAVRCAEKLLLLGANVNTSHYHDDEILSWCNPLISACASPVTNSAAVQGKSVVQMVELLVRYGADISRQNCYGQTALHWASRAGLVSVLPLLLRCGADIDARDNMGQTALMGVCDRGGGGGGRGCVEACRTLVTWGADVSCRGEKDDYSAFHFAVGNNNHELVNMFLDAGVCPTTGSRFKPISDSHCAYVSVRHDDASTWQQLTPLDIAVNNSQIDMVKCLLKAYADINAPSHYNQTVTTGGGLIYLASESAEITELLINAGFDRHSCYQVAKNRYLKGKIKEILKMANVTMQLKHMCRLVIRRVVAPNYTRCHELPLPRQLLLYVNMADLLS